MAIGVAIGEVGASSPGWLITSAVLQSLSVGLFLHLIFIGIIPTEFKRSTSGSTSVPTLCLRLGLMALGWMAFMVLMMFFGHNHSG